MNFLAYLISLLLLGGYWLFTHLHTDGMALGFSGVIWLFALSVFTYYRVSTTPTEDTEVYKSWKELLPTKSGYKRHCKQTIHIIVYAFVAYLLVNLCELWIKPIGGFGMWGTVILFVVSYLPLLYVFLVWAQGKTLKKAKLCFETMGYMLNSKGYVQHRTPYTKPITPDTALLDLFKSDKDVLNIPMMVAAFEKIYELPNNFLGKDSSEEWMVVSGYINEFENSKSEELSSEAIPCLVEFGRKFAQKYPTLGCMAILMADNTSMGKINEKKEHCAKYNAVGKWGLGRKEDSFLPDELLTIKEIEEINKQGALKSK